MQTVGEVAAATGVTVRTLHHWDEVGLVVPSARSAAGYRLYDDADVARLAEVVGWRRLGLSLDEIAAVLDGGNRLQALRSRRSEAAARVAQMTDLVAAIDRAIEREVSGVQLSREEQVELFGDGFSEEYAVEAEERWGGTDAWRESRRRTQTYTRADWERIAAEDRGIRERLAELMRRGVPADAAAATALAEEHRQHIGRWFYDCPPAMHRGLGEMYVADPRFAATYDDVAPDLAAYVRDAVVANADRAE